MAPPQIRLTHKPLPLIHGSLLGAILILFPFFGASAANSAAPETTGTLAASTAATTVSRKGPIPPPRRDVPGKRAQVALGKLYVPGFFRPPAQGGTDVVVFFHGAAWCSEQNFFDAGRNAVLVSVSMPMGDYARVFRDPDALGRLLDDTTTTLGREGVTTAPVGRICLASFSGGYSAVREILRHGRFRESITDVVLADSLYAGRVEGTSDTLKADDMAPFVDAARRAAGGRMTFLFSHLYPPEARYRNNTTTLAADYLLSATRTRRVAAHGTNAAGAQLAYRARKGKLTILGYSGMTTQDHFNHFYALSDLLRETSLPPAGGAKH
jgi:hypothetical protein